MICDARTREWWCHTSCDITPHIPLPPHCCHQHCHCRHLIIIVTSSISIISISITTMHNLIRKLKHRPRSCAVKCSLPWFWALYRESGFLIASLAASLPSHSHAKLFTSTTTTKCLYYLLLQ